MIVSRFQFVLAVAVGAATAAGLVWTTRENTRLRREAAHHGATAAASAAEISRQIAVHSHRAAAAEADVDALLRTTKSPRPSLAHAEASSGASDPLDTQAVLKAALAHAARLIAEARHVEALDVYLKCYRELQAKRPGSSECQSLTSAIRSLGRTYPPALPALGELRDATMRLHLAHPEKRELVFELALLNERLGEGSRTLALYDSLPPHDPQRHSLAMIAYKSFVEARRYADALVGKPFGKMLHSLEAGIPLVAQFPGPRQAGIRTTLIDDALTGIEVLTGAGQAADAKMLTEKLLAFDGSGAVHAAVKAREARAGSLPPR